MLFFLHHCELPSLDHVNRVHPPLPVRPPLVDAMPEGGNGPHNQDIMDTSDSVPHEEAAEVVEMNEVNEDSSDSHVAVVEEDREGDLMRPQLHRIPDTNNDGVLSSIQDSGTSQSRKLSDEELRQIRLQHFEKK